MWAELGGMAEVMEVSYATDELSRMQSFAWGASVRTMKHAAASAPNWTLFSERNGSARHPGQFVGCFQESTTEGIGKRRTDAEEVLL